MFELCVKSSFCAAHHLQGYKGRCANIHGHTFAVKITITGQSLDQTGMLLDFTILKVQANEVVKKLDHTYLNEIPPFCSKSSKDNPTAENIARYIYFEIKKRIESVYDSVKVKKVTVWESETASATFSEK